MFYLMSNTGIKLSQMIFNSIDEAIESCNRINADYKNTPIRFMVVTND